MSVHTNKHSTIIIQQATMSVQEEEKKFNYVVQEDPDIAADTLPRPTKLSSEAVNYVINRVSHRLSNDPVSAKSVLDYYGITGEDLSRYLKEKIQETKQEVEEEDQSTIKLSPSDFDSPVEEPLLEKNPSRFVMFPVQYDGLWDKYKLLLSIFDTAEHVLEKVDKKKEREHWNALPKEEQEFLKHALYSFMVTYSIGSELRIGELINAVQLPEARAFLSIQMSKESINAEMFSSLFFDCYSDESSSLPAFDLKVKEWYSTYSSLPEKLIAQVAMKGIFFTVLKCVVYWITKEEEERLPGLSKSNAVITQDLVIQAEFACMLYSMLNHKRLTEKRIESILREAVDLEKSVIPQKIKGLEAKEVAQYIEYVADGWMEKLRCNKIYKVSNPFQQWMPPISSKEMPRITTRKKAVLPGLFTLEAEF